MVYPAGFDPGPDPAVALARDVDNCTIDRGRGGLAEPFGCPCNGRRQIQRDKALE